MSDKSKTGFSIYIDEERGRTLNWMFNIFFKVAEQKLATSPIPPDAEELRKLQAVNDFCEYFGEPFHEMGWCQDPHCEYGKTNSSTRTIKRPGN